MFQPASALPLNFVRNHLEKQMNSSSKTEVSSVEKIQRKAEQKRLNNAASALDEAEMRRELAAKRAQRTAPERNGRGGLDPSRYGDWEVNGRATDF